LNLYLSLPFDQDAAIKQGKGKKRMLQIYKELIIIATIIFYFNSISDIYNTKRDVLTVFATLYTLFIHPCGEKTNKHEIIKPYLLLIE